MLHIVNKSPFEKNSLEQAIANSKEGSAILLIEDAVYAAKKNTAVEEMLKEALAQNKIHVLGPDFNARGFTNDDVIDGVTIVDYHGFVDLVENNGTVQSWV